MLLQREMSAFQGCRQLIPCYDAELIHKIALESGFHENYIQEAGEYAPNGLLSNVFSSRAYGSMNLLSRDDVEDNIMRLESREVAQELLGMTLS